MNAVLAAVLLVSVGVFFLGLLALLGGASGGHRSGTITMEKDIKITPSASAPTEPAMPPRDYVSSNAHVIGTTGFPDGFVPPRSPLTPPAPPVDWSDQGPQTLVFHRERSPRPEPVIRRVKAELDDYLTPWPWPDWHPKPGDAVSVQPGVHIGDGRYRTPRRGETADVYIVTPTPAGDPDPNNDTDDPGDPT